MSKVTRIHAKTLTEGLAMFIGGEWAEIHIRDYEGLTVYPIRPDGFVCEPRRFSNRALEILGDDY